MSSDKARDEAIRLVVLETYGGILQEQGRGFYVPLEFFAIVWGTDALGEPILRNDGASVRYKRRTHDFARRLLAEPDRLTGESKQHISDSETEDTLRRLLLALTVPVPGRRSLGNWRTQHFFPYVGELIHHEAVMRGSRVNIERNYYRGGGALVHRILRDDPDHERLGATRDGFRRLIAPSGSALSRVASALCALDEATDDSGFDDANESDARCLPSDWLENLREGVHKIVCRDDVPRAKRVDALMHWMPLCIALHELTLASMRLNGVRSVLPVDCRPGNNPVRALSRERAKQAVSTCYLALAETARSLGEEDLLEGSQKWRQTARTFFSTTAGTIGLFNALKGVRFFTFKPQLLEAIVFATVEGEIEFERFCGEVLFERLGFVVDGPSATGAELLHETDRAAFDDNAQGLLGIARDLGIVHEFSDATRMIRARLS